MKILRSSWVGAAGLCLLLLLAAPSAQAAPGDLDSLDAGIAGGIQVYATAVQPDGKLILGGAFTSVLGVPRQYVARLNADGTLDAGFDPKPNGEVRGVAVQADGKVVLGGVFTTLQPNGAASATARQYLARVHADGALDAGFDPRPSSFVYSLALQADGQLVFSGNFTSLNPNGAGLVTARGFIARVNANGSLDAGFDPRANGQVFSVALQADGRVLLGGPFTELRPNGAGPTTRLRVARVNSDGTLDAVFNPAPDGAVYGVAQQANGQVLLGGIFTTVAATARQRIARVNADGSLDTGFDPRANGRVTSVALQADGQVLLSGDFTTLHPNGVGSATARQRIARLNASGSLAAGFDPKADFGVSGVALQADGRVLLGGNFTALQPNGATSPTGRLRFARLLNDPATQVLSALDPARVRWSRGGAGPAVTRVTFELSSDSGVTWVAQGAGARVGTTQDWERPGLALPATGWLRARGTTIGGYSNGSSGLIEQVAAFSFTAGAVDPLNAGVVGGQVFATAVQPDGKVILAGVFTSVLGVARQNIARLNADGTLDTAFDPRPNGQLLAVAVQGDGKVLCAGSFSTLHPNGAGAPFARSQLARVNADGTLDVGFDPKPNTAVLCLAVQADGKVLLGGGFTTLQPNGAGSPTTRFNLARVNADGTLDAGFNPRPNSTLNSLAVQADGKVLLGGFFTTLQPNGAASPTTRQSIARVNADGTLDPGFDPNADVGVNCLAVQADGRIVLGGRFTTLQPAGAATPTARSRVARLHADGTLDATFDPSANDDVLSLAVQTNGQVLLAGVFTTLQPNGAAAPTARNFIARVHADGTLDPPFDPHADFPVRSVALQADARVLLAGSFTSLQPNGAGAPTARSTFARLVNDPATQSLTVPTPAQVLWNRGGAGPELARASYELSTNGGVNWTPLAAPARIGSTPGWQLTGLALPNTGGLIRARGVTTAGIRNGSAGLLEQVTAFGFTPGALDPLNAAIVGTGVYAAAVQPDGRTILAGNFSSVLGVARQHVARLNADGTLDAAFDPKPDAAVNAVAVQADGRVLLGGGFTTLQPNGAVSPFARRGVARLNMDGTLDAAFDPNPNGGVVTLALQADGKVLLGGSFTTLQPSGAASPTARRNLARVNADGTLDPIFDPSPDSSVFVTAVQPDGQVLLGGFFTALQPNGAASATARLRIARVNGDGTLDTGFDPRANNTVYSFAVQPDGKVVLSGFFTTLQPNGAASATARQNIARVNADGTLDPGFDPRANSYVIALAAQADGRVLLGGGFTTLQPNGAASATARSNIARVNADGSLDMAFDPRANGDVYALALQADGRVLLGGFFTTLQPNGAALSTARNRFARLFNDAATQTLATPTSTEVRWSRSGTAPELTRATFELSTDAGLNWTPLGGATRLGATAHWQRTGLLLPVRGLLRARGATASGYTNGSAGLLAQVSAFDRDSDADGLLDSWELLYFPTLAGQSALDDFDRDGIVALLELAFGLNPIALDAASLPQATNEAGYLTITINKRAGVLYEVQSAGTLVPDTFTPATTTVLVNNASILKVRDNILIGLPPARFVRVKVTAAP